MEKESKSLVLAECGIMVAMAIVLSFVKVIDMPFGGSVTAFSMLPVIVASYRHGIKWGMLTGFTYSLVQLLLGLNNVGYATTYMAMIAIILLDYILAFSVLGLAAMFRKIKSQPLGLATGTLLVCAIRYVCHIISGCTVWAGVSIPTGDGLVYSVVYNGAYMIPETVVTVAAAWMVAGIIDFRSDKITRRSASDNAVLSPVAILPVVVAVIIDFLVIFKTIQTEEGFEITGITDVNVPVIIVVLVVGAVLSVIINIFVNKK